MEENKNNNPKNTHTLFSVPITGCLMIIILSAIAGIMVNECKRSQIRLENDRRKYQTDTTVQPNKFTNKILFLKNLPRAH